MINAIGIALSGLNSAAQRVSVGASNIANVLTSGSLENGEQAPYTPLDVQTKASADGGVQTTITPRDPAFTPSYAPDSPFANADGYIGAPNVDIASEIVTMKLAEISYKANAAVLKTTQEMQSTLLREKF